MAERENPAPQPHQGDSRHPQSKKGWNSTAFALATALVVALGAMALFSQVDRSRRTALETVTEPTAVGDTRVVQAGENVERPLCTFEGRTLIGDSVKKQADSRMLKVGTDDSGSFTIYRLAAKESARGSRSADSDNYFLKAAPGQYIKLNVK